MSALGQKQTYAVHQPMSALPPIATAKADIGKCIVSSMESGDRKGARVPGTLKIIPHDKSLEPQTFTNVFPIKYSDPNLNAEGNEVSVETIEITAEGMATEKGCDR